MLLEFTILPAYLPRLRGVTHANGTARIQTLSDSAENPLLYKLLCYLQEKHQVLALINTSFNRQSEPIVHTAEQALKSAKPMGLDAVAMNNRLIIIK